MIKRVLIVCWAAHLGGVESSVYTRMKGLRQLGVEPELLFYQTGEGLRTFRDFQTIVTSDPYSLLAKLRDGSYDGISLVNFTHFMKAIRMAEYKRPVVFEVHGRLSRLKEECGNLSAEEVAAIMVPSDYTKAIVRRALGDKAIPIASVFDAVDTDLFHPSDGASDHLAAVLPKETRVLLWVGRLDPNKNWTELLAIASRLSHTRNDLEWWVVSDTSVSPDTDAFDQQVKLRQLSPVIRLFERVPHEQMPQFYRAAAQSGGCTLSTSISEGLQNSLLEAMACGCPVISSSVGGNIEMITHGTNGLLYPLGDISAATEAINQLLGHPSERAGLINGGISAIAEHHSPIGHARAFLALLGAQR
ncbi:MAG: glycosyltransferase family 4 protein [Bacillota bacterium]